MIYKVSISRRLKAERALNGLKQSDMAKKIGISESYYNLVENGNRRLKIDLAIKIAAALNKTLDDLFLPEDFPKWNDMSS